MAHTRLSDHERLHVNRLFSVTSARPAFRHATVYTHGYVAYRNVCAGRPGFVTVRNDGGFDNGTPKLYI